MLERSLTCSLSLLGGTTARSHGHPEQHRGPPRCMRQSCNLNCYSLISIRCKTCINFPNYTKLTFHLLLNISMQQR
ncbi:hypothetical protein BDZ91DRAFT_253916 [Kalaharituber pfeilii]|nr:hypothetical protein BDZ91DRAFT_253916 [Kalaharituber pfeilii]